MPKALSDDLRCRILEAYSRGEGSQRELAQRFGVSFEYVRKVRWQLRQNGQMKRVPQSRHGPLSRMTAAVQERLRGWLREQPDRTWPNWASSCRSAASRPVAAESARPFAQWVCG